jgi:hypothetical protein
MAQHAARVAAHRGNRAAFAAWRSDEGMDQAAVAMVRKHQQRMAREKAIFHDVAIARAVANAQADAVAEAARAWAAQAEAARQAHWANALAEGQARRAVEELPWVAREREWRVATEVMTPRERHCLVHLRQREIWGRRAAAALVLLVMEAAPTCPVASTAGECE